jgi:hypothetical protein
VRIAVLKNMRRLLSYLPFLAAISVFAALIEAARDSAQLPYCVAAIGIVLIATSGTLCLLSLFRGSAIAPGAMPALLVGGASFIFFFLEQYVLQIAVAAATSILFLVLVRHLVESTKLVGAAAELRALTEWSALVALVGLAAGLLGAMTFLNWNPWLSALAFAVVASYATFALARLGGVRGWLVPTSVSLLLAQGFIAIGLLPTSHWVGAGVIGAIAYLLFSILTAIPSANIRRTAISVSVICAVLLGTARWR